MVVMEATKLTGYSAIDLEEVRQQVGSLKRVVDEDDRTVLYFDEVCIRRGGLIVVKDCITDGPSDLPVCCRVSGYNEYESNMIKI